MSASAELLVREFLAAIERNHKDEVLSFFDEDSRFNNIPMGVVTGPEGVWQVLGPLHEKVARVEYRLLHIAASADTPSAVVMTERLDIYELNGQLAEFPVMGVFEVEDGRIREWRDYFDLQQCLAQLPEDTALPETDQS